MDRDDLIAFETRVADLFNAGKIRHPVHLSDGNEDGVVDAFRDISPDDWVCGNWRMHYQCLLKGVPPEDLLAAIYRGESIALCFPEHRIVSSAIVGGILPIAVGLAMGIKRRGAREWVHCFLGDMTSETGIFHECRKYAINHDLHVRWIIEDNGISVCSPTAAAWGEQGEETERVTRTSRTSIRYAYRSKYPHAGAGRRIQF